MTKKWLSLVCVVLAAFALSAAPARRIATGDILLADGTAVSPAHFTKIDRANPPVAVAADIRTDGSVLAVGLHISTTTLPWSSDGSTGNARTDYPASLFAEDYARSQGFTGALVQGWYLPSIAELSAVYRNRSAINAALHRIHALDGSCAEDTLGTNWYWSSTQSEAKADYAWFIHFYNGYTAECPKNFTNLHALAVRVF